MKLHDLHPSPGSKKKKKRLGRGPGSGFGKTAGKGHKGLLARAGGANMAGFEGGQMPLARRLPKRGFTNVFRIEYTVVNIQTLAAQENTTEFSPAVFRELGLLKAGILVSKFLVRVILVGHLSLKPINLVFPLNRKLRMQVGKPR